MIVMELGKSLALSNGRSFDNGVDTNEILLSARLKVCSLPNRNWSIQFGKPSTLCLGSNEQQCISTSPTSDLVNQLSNGRIGITVQDAERQEAYTTETQQSPTNFSGTREPVADFKSLSRDQRRPAVTDILDWLDNGGSKPEIHVYALLLRDCGTSKALSDGERIHAHIINSGHEDNIFLGNLLLQMYAKCRALDKARAMFDKMSQKNVFSWTIMIGAYAQNGKGRDALLLFQVLQLEGIVPDIVTCVTMLSVCSSEGALIEGYTMHAYIIHTDLEHNLIVGNALVNMYSKCGHIEDARRMFDKLPERSVISWNGMITAYSHHGRFREALEVFKEMQIEGEKPNLITFISVLSAYADEAALAEGRKLHAYIVTNGFEVDGILGNALVSMYGKCGSVEDAWRVFENMAERSVLSWNAIIGAYSQHSQCNMAFSFFEQMQMEGLIPDKVTFISLLDACAQQSGSDQGKNIHACVVDSGFELDVVVGTGIVHMYGKCKSLDDSRIQFEKMIKRDVISWNVMIAVYAEHQQWNKALELFQQMHWEEVRPDTFTFVSILDACSSQAALSEGKGIHTYLLSNGFEINVVVETALLNMYGKCGSLDDASRIFYRMSQQDVISWNALITAYTQHGQGKEALRLFQILRSEGVLPDQGTFVTLFDTCATLAALGQGKWIHSLSVETGFESNIVVATAIISMYGKCGSLGDAHRMFNKMPEHDSISWTAIITINSQHGLGTDTLRLFNEMKMEGNIPSNRTFCSVLSSCSHSGLLDEGWQCFNSISQEYGMKPTVDHYNCMIDLLGRAGRASEGENLIHNIPLCPSLTSWIALLSACRNNLDLEIAERAAENAFELDPSSDAAYALLSNTYAAAGRWEDVDKIRKRIEVIGVLKQTGCSSIEIRDGIHHFFEGGGSHPQIGQIMPSYRN